MSAHIARPSHDEEANSGTSSQAHQPSWMSHWMKRNLKPTSSINNSSLIGYKNGDINNKSCSEESRLKIGDGFQKSGKRLGKEVEEVMTGIISENPMKKTRDFQNKVGYSAFPALKLGQEAKNTSTMKAQMDHEYGDKAISLALSLGQGEDCDSLQKNNLRSSEKRAIPHSYPGQNGLINSRPSTYKEVGSPSHLSPHHSNHADASGPVVLFERHLSNDNFTCLGQGHCKYQKFSTVLFHEKNMNNELSLELRRSDGLQMQSDPTRKKKNFLPFFLRKQSENVRGQDSVDPRKFCHGWQAGDKVPCSVRNVETMRICTMVDSVENSPGGPPKISQRAHHFLFTKETCVNMSEAHQELRRPPTFSSHHNEEKTFGSSHPPRGVKIQPLWTSTDSEEKENTGNPSICKAESRNESSDETQAMQVEAPESQHIMSASGKELCSSNKVDAVTENAPPPGFDSNTEKARSKRATSEIPDINEELPGLQAAVSSTDGTEPSTSRVHSLDAKQLFPCGEQMSRLSELNAQKDRPLGLDASSRWIKRLKSSTDSIGVGTKSSELGEASSNEKFSQYFNRIMKTNKGGLENMLSKHQYGKEQMMLDENVKSLANRGSSSLMGSKRETLNMALGSSWIQRWCQNSPTSPAPASNPEPLVICEPHSLKLGQDELSKKQFPSIAAMALMGKAMNGSRPCEFRKRGPIVVWNTDEY